MKSEFFKNWKSTMAFYIFVYIYYESVHAVTPNAMIVSTTGYVALTMAVVMVLRNDMTPTLIEKLFDKLTKDK